MNARKDLRRYGFQNSNVGGLWLEPEEVFEFIDKLEKEAYHAGFNAGVDYADRCIANGPFEHDNVEEYYRAHKEPTELQKDAVNNLINFFDNKGK